MHEHIELSLVINTRNRAKLLPPFLETLEDLTCSKSWEIVLVDNGSTDETLATLQAFCAKAPDQRRVIVEPEPGSSRAKNSGILAARGKIICFTDDDCYPAPDFLERTLESFHDPAMGFVAGRVMLHDPEDAPMTILTSTEPIDFPPDSFIRPGSVLGANFAFRREPLEKTGMFDPFLGAGTQFPCEDCDMVMRVSEAGWRGRYDPAIVVSHHHRRRGSDEIDRLLMFYAQGRGVYFMKFLIHSRHPLRIARNWWRSAKYFGLKIWLRELHWGLKYLVGTKARRAE